MTLVMLLPRLRETHLPERAYFSGPLSQFVRRYFSWFVIDALTAFVSISLVGLLWRLGAPLDMGWGISFGIAVVMSILFSTFNYLLGLDRISWRHAGPALVLKLILSGGLVVLVISLVNRINLPLPKLPLGLIWEAGALSLTGMIIFRYRERLLTGLASRWLKVRSQAASAMGERALIVGAGEQAQLVSWLLTRRALSNPISIAGMVDDDVDKVGLRIGDYRVVGSIPEIPDLVAKKGIGLIFYAINNVSVADRKRILNICRGTPARLVVVPDLIKIFRDELVDKEVES